MDGNFRFYLKNEQFWKASRLLASRPLRLMLSPLIICLDEDKPKSSGPKESDCVH